MGLGCRLGPPDYQRAVLGTSGVTLPFSPQAAPLCSRTEEAGALAQDEYEEDSSDEEVGLGLNETSCEVRAILPGLSWCLMQPGVGADPQTGRALVWDWASLQGRCRWLSEEPGSHEAAEP